MAFPNDGAGELKTVSSKTKNALIAAVCLLMIGGSGSWIYYREFKAPKHDVRLHRRVGEVMAEETARVVGPKGRLVLITIPTANQPELKTQLEAFRRRLKKLGDYEIKEHELDPKEQPKYAAGAGLSGRRFARTVKNNQKADAIVSFVGAPRLSDDEITELGKVPRFIAETRTPDHLPKLFEKQIISVAVASRFTFPAPGPRKPRTAQELFDRRYQIVAADSVAAIPKGE